MAKCCDQAHACSTTPSDITSETAAIATSTLQIEAEGHMRTRLRIHQMDCPTEEKMIRDKLGSMAGVSALEFNLMQRTLTVIHRPQIYDAIIAALRSLDFVPENENDANTGQAATPIFDTQTNWKPLIFSGLAAISAELVEFSGVGHSWLVIALALAAISSGGISTYKKGWIAIKNRNLNINALMSIAVTGALLIGQWPEAAMVMFLFALAEVIEAKSIERARHAIRGLMSIAPDKATVQQPGGLWGGADVKNIPVGATVRVRPGERIGLDGKVLQGRSSVNQAPITGESLPVEKSPGDLVFAGSINQDGELTFEVTATASQSTLARIIHAVEEAQGARAPTQRFVDQFAAIYTPVVFVFALLIALLAPVLTGGGWLEWAYRALVLLVIACPCALVISTPVTIVSGLAAAARQGILVKGGIFLEMGHRLSVLALDKTGTLTTGKPEQTDFDVIGADKDSATLHSLALSLVVRSDHPVSKALLRSAPPTIKPQDVDVFTAIPGLGIRGELNGKTYHLGNHRLIEDLGLCSPSLEQRLSVLERQGKTVILLADATEVLALFAVADTLKATSLTAIAQLHTLGVKTIMLTGDNQHTAQAIAQQVGIDEAYGDLLPQDKLNTVETLIEKGNVVGMVGDGINDAPALARANIGFAMAAAGTDTAIETADVALMDDDLRKIAVFVQLSRQTVAILRQNIGLALGIKAVFLGLAVAGSATLWMAVFADMGASLLVVVNGLRMLKKA